MDTDDVVNMPEQFARNMSEFSARILYAWSDAAKRMGLPSGAPDAEKVDTAGWAAISEFAKTLASPSSVEKLQDAMKLAAGDLPVLMNSLEDPGRVGRIKSKWEQFCEKSMRELLGVPGPSETEKLLDHWRSIMACLPTGSERTSFASMPSVLGLISPSGWPLPGVRNAHSQVFRTWADTYGKTWDSMLLPAPRNVGQDYVERTREAIEAQIRFLQCLPEFQVHMVTASKHLVQAVFENLQTIGIKEMSAESQGRFYASWVSASEQMFRELFGSDIFLQTLTETVQQGLDAKKKMENVLADWPSAWDNANKEDVENLQDKLYTLEKRVRLLERELDDLKQELTKPLARETAPMGNEE